MYIYIYMYIYVYMYICVYIHMYAPLDIKGWGLYISGRQYASVGANWIGRIDKRQHNPCTVTLQPMRWKRPPTHRKTLLGFKDAIQTILGLHVFMILQKLAIVKIYYLVSTRALVLESLFCSYFRKLCSGANQIAFHDYRKSSKHQ